MIKITIQAVAAFKHDYLTGESVLLDIKDGIVVKVTPLTRAPDQHATAISQCIPTLWSTLKTNPIYREQDEVKPKPAKPAAKEGS